MEDNKNLQKNEVGQSRENANNMNLVFVNNDYAKMSRRKNEVLQHNANTIKTNNSIKRAKRWNTVFTLLFSLLISGGIAAYIWFNFNIHIASLSLFTSKLITIALVVFLVFLISESASYIYKVGIEKKKKTVKNVTEAMNFVTFMHNKKLKDYTVSAYEEVPYETQKIYFTVYVEDENEKELEYTSMDKWNLVLLPVLFDVIIDAEHTTIYLPCKDEKVAYNVRRKLQEEIILEQVTIEKEERAKVEQALSETRSEKEAIERVLRKAKEQVENLETALENAKTEIESAENKHNVVVAGIALDCENAKKEAIAVQETLNIANEKNLKLEEDNAALKVAVEELKVNANKTAEEYEQKLNSITAAAEAEKTEKEQLAQTIVVKDNAIKSLNDRLSRMGDALKSAKDQNAVLTERLNDTSVADAYERRMGELTKKHEEEVELFKQRINKSVQEAKDAVEHQYAEEVSALKQENARLSSSSNVAVLTSSLRDKEEAFKKEEQLRIARENELNFEKDKVKMLEEKLHVAESRNEDALRSFASEKIKFAEELAEQKRINNELEKQKSALNASSGVQERALLKEKTILENRIQQMQEQLDRVKDVDDVRRENASLKRQLEGARNVSVESMKQEYEQKLLRAKEEKDRAEKKMREALESAAKEKSERLKSENILRQHMSDQERLEHEKRMALQEAELAKAREAAAKAQQDAMKANVNGIDENRVERKRSTRKLNL